MNPVITFDNIRSFAYVNDSLLKDEPIGMVISFFGLGCQDMYTDNGDGEFFARHNLLYLVPYSNPWGWMNAAESGFTDELVRVLCDRYGKELKIASTGGSMGGTAALTYCCKAALTPVVCVANCPVCDSVYHYDERVDLPRTYYSALYREAEGDADKLKAELEKLSPLHLVGEMPDIPYHVFHCTLDKLVKKEVHSDRFVEAMIAAGRKVRYIAVEGRGHCDLGEEYYRDYRKAILSGFGIV